MVEAGRLTSNFRPEADGAFFDLSARAKLRILGSDRLRYLNGQVTNDVRKASETSAIHACILNAKGRIDAEGFIATDGEGFLIDAELEAGAPLMARLERYIIADDVQVEDVTNEFALFHVIGGDISTLSLSAKFRQSARFGELGTDVWLNQSDHDASLKELSRIAAYCDETCADLFRIERGLPRWGFELTEAIIPTEANLEGSAIDFAKGCYIGQEVISRIKMSGQTNKRLCGLVTESKEPLRNGMRLMTPEEKKEVGWITSNTTSERLGKRIALGFVKRGFQEPGTRLCASEAASEIGALVDFTIVPLPFT